MKVRTRERRDLLTAVRASILRVAFLADGVLAITVLLASNRPTALRRAAHVRDEMKSAAHRLPPSCAVYRGTGGKRQLESGVGCEASGQTSYARTPTAGLTRGHCTERTLRK